MLEFLLNIKILRDLCFIQKNTFYSCILKKTWQLNLFILALFCTFIFYSSSFEIVKFIKEDCRIPFIFITVIKIKYESRNVYKEGNNPMVSIWH